MQIAIHARVAIGQLSKIPRKKAMASTISLRQLSAASGRRHAPQPVETVRLNPEEDRLCTLLDECTKQLQESRADLKPIECRIAGGWVRDKLLGMDSNDIDIGLSSIMGITFAELFVPFLEERGLEVKNVTKIARNPEQSKHLETAKATLMGMEIDFVNLRSEEYALDSRIPTKIEFGTPLQDALRRDITINALFYNVHTRSVEDWTGKGLQDLKDGIVRTPLPPRETFLDDPLRILRCVRFASRFGFELEDTLVAAILQEEIQDALVSKISRERVGDELDKMLKGRDPLLSLLLIEKLALHRSIFLTPDRSRLSSDPASRRSAFSAGSILSAILSDNPPTPFSSIRPKLVAHARTNHGMRRRLYLACALSPFRGITYKEKKRTIQASEAVIREGLKIGAQNHYITGVPLLLRASQLLSRPSLKRFSDRNARVAIGLVLRDKAVSSKQTDAHWTSSLLFSLIQDLVDAWDLEGDRIEEHVAEEIIQEYNGFLDEVERLGLENDIHEPPRLNGREVCEALNSPPGVWTASVLSEIVCWQLENPQGSKDECLQWLHGEVSAGRLVTNDPGKQAALD